MKLTRNITVFARAPGDIKYIVVHDTGNTDCGSNAISNFEYFESIHEPASSADFVVDDTNALQINGYGKSYAWHCGDGHGIYGITNANSIGIEMCVNIDGNYVKTLQNTVKLIKSLKENLPAAKLVRHYDASRKICPGSMYSGGSWAPWLVFQKMCEEDDEMTNEEIRTVIGMEDASWAKDVIANGKKIGLLNPANEHDPNEPVTMGLLMQVITNLYNMIQAGYKDVAK